ncbi:MAG: NF038130 family PEP-CTERM protein [Cyanobacteriota bacterium]|nr:NF038130 family PEP-CTERM protein [Cyanobacteriota bacterium]
MKGKIQQWVMGASMTASAIAIASTSASAFTITGNNDYLLFDVCPPNFTCVNPNADIDSVLAGDSSAPGGNVELFASSENDDLASFLTSNARTSIEGTVAGKSIVVSSLTATDWFGSGLDTSYTADTFATKWFNEFYQNSGLAANETLIKGVLAAQTGQSSWLLAPSAAVRQAVYNAYLSDQVKGFQRSSDPNVSYITTSGNDLLIGLAGHYDVKDFYSSILGPLAVLINDGFQVSEVVKVNYGGVEELLYSFNATQSGLVNAAGVGADGRSHTGNYEVSMGDVITDVPEPSAMLGLLGLTGFVVAGRKARKSHR